MRHIRNDEKILASNPLFIVVDDDTAYNHISRITIRKIFRDAEVVTFTNPVQGLEYILKLDPSEFDRREVILLLDINMPLLNGFAVLDAITECVFPWMKKLRIYLVSSSIDQRDFNRSMSYEITWGYISKPITLDIVREVFLNPENRTDTAESQ